MNNPIDANFRWEDLSEEEKEALRAVMHARLTEPGLDFSTDPDETARALDPETVRIRMYMASNPNTPAPVLHHLAKTTMPAVLERIAENPRAHHTTLTSLAGHRHPDVRAAVADNSNAPVAVLRKLASDENPDVRYRLAENHNTPVDILHLLNDDPNPYVACRARRTLARLFDANLLPTKTWGDASTAGQGATGG